MSKSNNSRLDPIIDAGTFLFTILDSIGEGVVVLDRDFKIISANKTYSEQTKKPIEEILGKHCYEVAHNVDKPCYESGRECPLRQTFKTGESHVAIHTHQDKKGNPVYVELKSYPMKDSSGNVISAVEVVADVTERYELQQELKKRIKELEEFYDMAIGREVKMTELKEEIERLREELGKYKI